MSEVYAIGFPSGKLYIGITSKTAQERLRVHRKDAKDSVRCIHYALNKYGRDIRLIVLAQGVSFEEAKDLEVWWISRLGTMAPGGYNLTMGGDGSAGYKPTTETLKRLSESHKGLPGNRIGHKATKAQRKRMSEAHKGKKHTAQHRLKLSEIGKRSLRVADNIRKVSEVNKGRKHSIERKAKLSEVMKRWWDKRRGDASTQL